MFEVNLVGVKQEILRRVDQLLAYLFQKFEGNLIQTSQGICSRYIEISLFLKRELKTTKDIIEMDIYKNNLILEMTTLRDRIL